MENEYWVLATHTGSPPYPSSVIRCSRRFAFGSQVTSAAPYSRLAIVSTFSVSVCSSS